MTAVKDNVMMKMKMKVLSDDEKRGKYDRGEEIKPEGQQQGSPFQNPFAQHMHFRH